MEIPRITEAGNDEFNESQSAFASETQHVQGEIIEPQNTVPGASGNTNQAGQTPGAWTALEVGQQFAGLFAALGVACSFLRSGPVQHWELSDAQIAQLGEAFCPIFQKHVPYGLGAPSWLADAMLYVAAIGAGKQILWPAIQAELKLLREGKKSQSRSTPAQSSAESTQTETSGASSSQPENEEAESPSSSSENSDSAAYAY